MFKTENLYQNDARWKDVKLGLQDKETIGTWGCLLTSMTMVLNGFGYSETPETVNEKMKASGGFQGALIYPYVLPKVFPGIVFKGYDPCETSPAPLDRIDKALSQGLPVIVQVDWNPQPGIQTHYVVLYARDGSDYLMLDPYKYRGDEPGRPIRLTERYKYSGKTPAEAITGVIWFESANKTVPAGQPAEPGKPDKEPVPADGMMIYTTADGLALRMEPSVNGVLIRRLPLKTGLTTLESALVVRPKLGVVGSWIRVQTPQGEQGYVAAWYCDDIAPEPVVEPGTSVPTSPGSSESPADSGMLVLKPTQDGVAFRTQPVINDSTLIKRLPFTATLKALDVDAEKKVGQVNQWIKVEDITGQTGYVAAWYLTVLKNPALGVREERPDKKPDAPEQLIVRTTINKLALRAEGNLNGRLIKRLPLRAELLVLDPNQESNIGVQGKWLRVRELKGDEGYVAAWYVSR